MGLNFPLKSILSSLRRPILGRATVFCPLFVFWALLLFPNGLLATTSGAPRISCQDALLGLQATLPNSFESDSISSPEFHDRRTDVGPSVTVRSESPGRHGGKILTLERTGAKWISGYSTVTYDLQGDPRWFIEVLGQDAAEYFGFKILSDEMIQIPNPEEFNSALGKVDAFLREKNESVPISFFTTESDANVSVSKYVKSFHAHGAIPLAPSGNHLIHDISFHTGAIFLPPEVVNLKRATTRFLDGFVEYLQKKYAGETEKIQAIKYYGYLWRMLETTRIDSGTALVSPGIVAYLRDVSDENRMVNLIAALVFMTENGANPMEYVLRMINETRVGTSDLAEFINPVKLNAHLSNFSTDILIQDLFRFKVEYPNQQELSEIPFERFSDLEVLDAACKEITLRRMLIRDAALALLKGQINQ